MFWLGKLAGGALGYMFAGPVGVLLGIGVGHPFDLALQASFAVLLRKEGRLPSTKNSPDRFQRVFLQATFLVMGRLSKADGRVSEAEIAYARRTMDWMGLTPEQRREAMRLFAEGKQPDFPLDETLVRLHRECAGWHSLVRMFVGIQLRAAYADGVIHDSERDLLFHICRRLGFPASEFERMEAALRLEHGGPEKRAGFSSQHPGPDRHPLQEACALLGIAPDASDEAVKTAYRRLLSRHHPDKLMAQGATEEAIRRAAARTHEIRQAYERIRAARSGAAQGR